MTVTRSVSPDDEIVSAIQDEVFQKYAIPVFQLIANPKSSFE
jgi:hypothetical protein